MILEHDFITTRSEPDAMAMVQRLLTELGFRARVNEDDQAFEYVRGLKKAHAAKRPTDLPQFVRIHYDRGRVTLGIGLETHRTPQPRHRELLLILAAVIENVVGRDIPIKVARQPLDAFEAANPKRRGCLEIGLIVVLVVILVALALVIAITAVQ